MSIQLTLILILAAIVISIAFDKRFAWNIGIASFVCAFIIGCVLNGMTASELIALWPHNLFFRLMVIPIFFGFAIQNGTMKGLASHLVYVFRKNTTIIPIIIFILSFILSALGSIPPVTNALMAIIAFSIATQIGSSPVVMGIAVAYGATTGAFLPYCDQGAVVIGLLEKDLGLSAAEAQNWKILVYMFIFALIFLIVYGIVTKGFKSSSVTIEAPEPFTPVQKKTLILILLVVVIVLVPCILNLFIKSPSIVKFMRVADIQILCLIGAAACAALKLGELKKVLSESVPWNVLLMTGGVSALMGVATKLGATDYLASVIGGNIPTIIYPAMFAILGGLLSCFSPMTSVVLPALYPVAMSLASTKGISLSGLIICCTLGATLSSISPFSGGGAILLGNCTIKEWQEKLFKSNILIAIITVLIAAILGSIGVFSIL